MVADATVKNDVNIEAGGQELISRQAGLARFQVDMQCVQPGQAAELGIDRSGLLESTCAKRTEPLALHGDRRGALTRTTVLS